MLLWNVHLYTLCNHIHLHTLLSLNFNEHILKTDIE